MPRHRSTSIIPVGFLLLSMAGKCVLAQDPCDSLLHAENLGALGYGNRGDRCEGLYSQLVGSSAIWMVSLTENFGDFDPVAVSPLVVSWDTIQHSGRVHLRADGIRRKLYYRMDALPQPGVSAFIWKTDVLSSLGIQKSDLGILGVTSMPFARTTKEVYLPLRIVQQGNPGSSGPPGMLHLLLMPGVELTEVYLSLAAANSSGRPGQFISKDKKLGFGYYPAERAIDIPIVGLKKKGVYHEQVSALLKTGGTASIEFLFFYPGQ